MLNEIDLNLLVPFEAAFADLDRRAADVAILPTGDVPARFDTRRLDEVDFQVAMRAGDPQGHVDTVLARLGRTRRVAPTVPNCMLALSVVAETDLVTAVPQDLLAALAQRFGLVGAA